MQRHSPVREECLNFGHEQLLVNLRHFCVVLSDPSTHIALCQKLPHLQRVRLDLSSLILSTANRLQADCGFRDAATHLNTSWQVDTAQHQDGLLSRVPIDLPAQLTHLGDSSNHEITDFGVISRLDGFDRDELVDTLDRARYTRHDLVRLDICPVAPFVSGYLMDPGWYLG
jgi:hypothetical protein